ncbi:hypothetical protein GW17_00010616 [Ensete ventricosum]|nr:hypothetical protein GW17_00010616 [Ensete ventricosum]
MYLSTFPCFNCFACGLKDRSNDEDGPEVRPRGVIKPATPSWRPRGRHQLPASCWAAHSHPRRSDPLQVTILMLLCKRVLHGIRDRRLGKMSTPEGAAGVGAVAGGVVEPCSGLPPLRPVLPLSIVMVVLSPSLQSFPPAKAIRSSHYLRIPAVSGDYNHHLAAGSGDAETLVFRRAPRFHNAAECEPPSANGTLVCYPSLVHIAITLDEEYLRGSIAAVHSVPGERLLPLSTVGAGPGVGGEVRLPRASASRRTTLTPTGTGRLSRRRCCRHWSSRSTTPATTLGTSLSGKGEHGWDRTVGAREYFYANFTKYFTDRFWSDHRLAATFAGRATSTPG